MLKINVSLFGRLFSINNVHPMNRFQSSDSLNFADLSKLSFLGDDSDLAFRKSSLCSEWDTDNVSELRNRSADEIAIEHLLMKTDDTINLSFAGCGFLGLYHLGVAQALISDRETFLDRVNFFSGASAGSLVAALLCIKECNQDVITDAINFSLSITKLARARFLGIFTPGFSVIKSLRKYCHAILPENAHLIAKDRLYVSVTSFNSRSNKIICDYKSKSDLIDILCASSCIPFVTNNRKMVSRDNEKFVDGGFTDNLPLLQNTRNVTVSPFSGRQDISPTDDSTNLRYYIILNQDFQVSWKNFSRGYHALHPPSDIHHYLSMGYRDAMLFLEREKLKNIGPGLSGIDCLSQRRFIRKETSV